MATDPLTSGPNFVNPSYATPQQIAAMYEYSKQLLGQSNEPVRSPWQALANVARAGVGGYEGYLADEKQRQAQAAMAGQIAPLIEQTMGGQSSAPSAPSAAPPAAPMSAPAAPSVASPMRTAAVVPDRATQDIQNATGYQVFDENGKMIRSAGFNDGPAPSTTAAAPRIAQAGPPSVPQAAPAAPPQAPAQRSGMSAQALAAIMTNPWISPENRQMISALLQPQVIKDGLGNSYMYRYGQQPQLIMQGGHIGEFSTPSGFKGQTITTGTLNDPQTRMLIPGGEGGLNALEQRGLNYKREAANAEEEGKKAGAIAMTPAEEVAKEIRTAPQALNAINLIEDVARQEKTRGTTTGLAGEPMLKLRQTVNGLAGQNIMGETAGPEAMVKMNAYLASAATQAMTARGTQFDFKVNMANQPGNLMNSWDGTLYLSNIMKQIHRQNLELGSLLQKPENKYNSTQVIEQYYATHPIMDPVTGNKLGTISDTSEQRGGKRVRRYNPSNGQFEDVQ